MIICPLAGDRSFGDDDALLGGLGRFNGQSVVIMGQERGRIPKAVLNIILVWRAQKDIVKHNA